MSNKIYLQHTATNAIAPPQNMRGAYTTGSRNRRDAAVVDMFIKSVISGVLAAALTLLGIVLISFYYELGRGFMWYMSVGALAGVVVASTTWYSLLSNAHAKQTELVPAPKPEKHKPSEPPITLRVERNYPGGHQTMYSRIPVTHEAFEIFARRVLAGRSMSVGAMTGKGQPLTRSEYEQLMVFLDKSGIVRWANIKSKNQGRELTRPGRASLEAYLRSRNGTVTERQ